MKGLMTAMMSNRMLLVSVTLLVPVLFAYGADITPNDEGLIGADDSASIQNAIDLASRSGIGKVVIPALNARTKKPGWTISRSILLPGHMTVVLDNAHLVMAPNVYENFFRSKNTWTDEGRTRAGELREMRIIGIGNAVLDGGEANDLNESTHCRDGRPHVRANTPILFVNVRNIEIRNLTIVAHRYWGMCFEYCRFATISDIRFVAGFDRRNQDGINLRNGCSEFVIENISGQTGDDMIALSAIDVPRPDKFSYIVEAADPDIYNVKIRNVRGAAVCHPLVALRNHNGAKIYDVTIENVSDTPFADPCLGTEMARYALIRIGNGIYWTTRKSVMGETSNITIRGLDCRYSVLGVLINNTIKDSLISDVRCTGPCKAAVSTGGPGWGGEGAKIENLTIDNATMVSTNASAVVFDYDVMGEGDYLSDVKIRDSVMELNGVRSDIDFKRIDLPVDPDKRKNQDKEG